MTKHPDFFENDSATAIMPPRSERPRVVGAVLRTPTGDHRLRENVPCRVGSGPDNDIVLADRTVSRTHAVFTLGGPNTSPGEGVTVEDLGSRNGTFYLGNRIGRLVLGLGARIDVGSVTIAIEPDTEALLDDLDYPSDAGYRGMIGVSPRIKKLFALLQRLEGSLATVLIEGESGVGKEEIARAIHEGSPLSRVGADTGSATATGGGGAGGGGAGGGRGGGRLVTLNCGAIPTELVSSELFGHRRGAFTGAHEARAGAFETAHNGTLFLDEIGELPLDVQPALLRALETGEIRRVGTDTPQQVRVRVLAATNKDLEEEVRAGRFRADLFYRLAVVRVHAPPLRGRPEDIELLALHFAKAAGKPDLPRPILEELRSRTWPGNARELRNAIQAYAAVGQLPPPSRAEAPADDPLAIDPTEPYQLQRDRMIDTFTKAYLKSLLRYANGNQAAAARIGKMDRTYLGRLVSKYGLSTRKID